MEIKYGSVLIHAETKTIHKVDCSDLESLIEEVYGQGYSIEADQELGHDDMIEVKPVRGENNELDSAELELMRLGDDDMLLLQDFNIYTIMNDLADLGILKEDPYIIETC